VLNIYFFSDIFNGFFTGFLDIITVVSIFSGIFIIVTKNPIVSVLYLILLFSSISCYLIFIGLKFIGLSYLLVYVGAVSILFLFILMLINIRVSELISDTNNNIPLAILAIFAFFIPISNILPDIKINQNSIFLLEDLNSIKQVSYVSSNS
jgi:NADH-ubiquinone oxidoreductase chain 6